MKIERSIFSDLCNELSKPDVLILLGARQVGKSTLMSDLMVWLKKKQRKYRAFNLELPQDLLFFSKPEEELFEELTKQENLVIFIDEFHYFKNASKFFKAVYDLNKGIKIIASGSSSLEMHKHLKESLVGRRKVFKVYPLDWLDWSQTGKDLNHFTVFGGLPGLVRIESRDEVIEYLSQIVQTYILKDIKGLIKEENIRAFNHLLFYLSANQGQVCSTSNMAREIGMTNRTIENYLEVLEQTFVVYGLHSFSKNLSNELKKSRKYYFYDNGVRNSLMKNFSKLVNRKDKGLLFESLVFLELKKRLKANVELRFWRTKLGEEIDFIWIEDQTPIPLEVKATYSGNKASKSLLKFLKAYPNSPYGVVLNTEVSKDLELNGRLIKIRRFNEIDSILPHSHF